MSEPLDQSLPEGASDPLKMDDQQVTSPSESPVSYDDELAQLWDAAYERVRVDFPNLWKSWRRCLGDEEIKHQGVNYSLSDNMSAHVQSMKQELERWLSKTNGITNSHDHALIARLSRKYAGASTCWIAAYLASESCNTGDMVSSPLAREAQRSLLLILFKLQCYCELPRQMTSHGCEDEKEKSRLKYVLLDLYTAVLAFAFTLCGTEEIEQELGPQLAFVDRLNDMFSADGDVDSAKTTQSRDAPMDLDIADPQSPLPHLRTESSCGKSIQERLCTTPEYSALWDWEWEENNQLLCISGEPGAGKTEVLASIVRHMVSETEISRADVYHCFCGSGEESKDNVASVIHSLTEQIIERHPRLKDLLKRKARSLERTDFSTVLDFPAICDVFHQMITSDLFKRAFIVIDSVDECWTDNAEPIGKSSLDCLLKLIWSTGPSRQVRWLISVDSANVGGWLDSNWLHLGLGSITGCLRPAIEEHAANRMSETVPHAGEDSVQEKLRCVQAKLVEKSCDNFLWIDLACLTIQSHDAPCDALQILDRLPKGLQSLYQHALDDMASQPSNDTCKQVLYACALASRPLRLSELNDLLCLPAQVDLRDLIVKKCVTFLALRDDRAYFVNNSARVFLQTAAKKEGVVSDVHGRMTQGCLKLLSTLFGDQDIVGASSHYAVDHWMTHFCGIEPGETNIELVATLLENFLLEWLESISLIRRPSQAILKMLNVEASLKMSPGPPRLKVKNSLLFYPSRSDIKQRLLRSNFPRLMTDALVEPTLSFEELNIEWQGLDGNCYYSPDGRFIVAPVRSKVLHFWDARTGEVQNTITAKDSIDDWLSTRPKINTDVDAKAQDPEGVGLRLDLHYHGGIRKVPVVPLLCE
ncbi:hypothetical protein CDD80_1439 [Ophiocordyceps camponoti-rufipedis]|uniref:Nephrocystin 3-like N-terminal domain-containing protein n=1 Tax=Ophiocordyceps camponoti-rufipedis TaxID=2004952 RepID=A0A2C5Z9I0_9HYPO|nr:hypothetical protein CDD80_1439 [Ophiocordyceps camponoti-rufipedis]